MSQQETVFATGMFFFPPRKAAPDYVLGGISIKPNEFIEFLNTQVPDEKGYLRLVVKLSKGGKPYVSVDNYKKDDTGGAEQSTEPAEEINIADDF